MAFKDQYMWGLDVFLIDKHFTAIALLLCPAYQDHHAVAAPRRSPPQMAFTETQSGKNLKLLFIISRRLTVSLVNFLNQF